MIINEIVAEKIKKGKVDMYIPRQIDIYSELKKKSLFLFGPRQTGKTCLIANSLSKFRTYNMLDSKKGKKGTVLFS